MIRAGWTQFLPGRHVSGTHATGAARVSAPNRCNPFSAANPVLHSE
jgi:hypothetical protein